MEIAQQENKPLLTTAWIIVHAILAYGAVHFSFLSELWAIAVLLAGIFFTIRNKNQSNEAAVWGAYYVGLEVLLRATGGSLIWEFGKYALIVILLIGIMVDKKQDRSFPGWVVLTGLLLLPAIVFTFSWSDRIREDISFNISGIFALLVSSYYFYKRVIAYSILLKIFSYSLLPIISLAIVLFFKTPNIEALSFSTDANFQTSGGFGPNQVATILSYGWLIFLVLMIFKEKITANTLFSFAIFAFLLFRALFTFSRGGNLGAVLAFVAFISAFTLSGNLKLFSSRALFPLLLLLILSMIVVSQLNTITGGVFENRFMGKNMEGDVKEDITTGRLDILKMELELFKEHPMGVGAGGSRVFRAQEFDDTHATHNEFGRLISEHGILGVVVILILLLKPLFTFFNLRFVEGRAFLSMFIVLSLITLMHSAFRIALPAFLYGVAFIYLIPKEYEDPLYRQ